MNSWVFYFLGYKLMYSYFVAQAVLTLAIGSASRLAFDNASSLPLLKYNTFQLSGITRCSSLILYFPCHSPRITQSFKEAWFLLLRFRNQDMFSLNFFSKHESILILPNSHKIGASFLPSSWFWFIISFSDVRKQTLIINNISTCLFK